MAGQLEIVNFQAGSLDFDGVDPELGMHLLNLHWNRQHHSFMITYRPAFMRDMACNGPYFSKLLLNAIYYAASKFSPRLELRRDPGDVRTAGWRYRSRVKELLVNALDSSEITTIQALLVMTNSLFALGDERSAAWLYAGMAFRMIIDLGMHVDTQSPRLSDMDLEIRRRVFWAAFGKKYPVLRSLLTFSVVDKIQSLYQGRPASLQEFDIRVPLTFNDNYEELEHCKSELFYRLTTRLVILKKSIFPPLQTFSGNYASPIYSLLLRQSGVLNTRSLILLYEQGCRLLILERTRTIQDLLPTAFRLSQNYANFALL